MNDINYQKKLDDILSEIENIRFSLLLHSCCAPCSSYVILYLANYFDITVFYYNPNIYPAGEYVKRVEEQKRFINQIKLNNVNFIEGDYDNLDFLARCRGLEDEPEGGKRCLMCYRLRLLETVKMAQRYNFHYFCTTLTVSPYKNAKVINEIGRELEKQYSIKYLYSDFKKNDGYKKSIILSNKYKLYRQNYCGCKFSR